VQRIARLIDIDAEHGNVRTRQARATAVHCPRGCPGPGVTGMRPASAKLFADFFCRTSTAVSRDLLTDSRADHQRIRDDTVDAGSSLLPCRWARDVGQGLSAGRRGTRLLLLMTCITSRSRLDLHRRDDFLLARDAPMI
jgi:hypothetical protein